MRKLSKFEAIALLRRRYNKSKGQKIVANDLSCLVDLELADIYIKEDNEIVVKGSELAMILTEKERDEMLENYFKLNEEKIIGFEGGS